MACEIHPDHVYVWQAVKCGIMCGEKDIFAAESLSQRVGEEHVDLVGAGVDRDAGRKGHGHRMMSAARHAINTF